MTKTPVVPFVDLVAQYRAISSEIDRAMQDVVSRCDFILGEQVRQFEERFAHFTESREAIGVSSGLDALRLALAGFNIGPGDEVIVPANSYIATALAVTAVGAKPVFADCDSHTYNIDPERVERAITARTRAIIPVHLTGQSADMDPILELARRHRLIVIEDAAQAHGTRYKGRACGSMGDAGCFSFYPGKNLGAYGDGGMVTTNDGALAERLKRLRNYGQQKKYEHTEKGLNVRLDTLQAAVLNVKLTHLPEWNQARARNAALYRERLGSNDQLRMQHCFPDSTHIYHLFIIETAERDALQQHLEAHGVQCGIHYPKPIHLQDAYADLGHRRGDFPRTEALASSMLSLPMFPELTEQQITFVCDRVSDFYADREPVGAGLPTAHEVGAR